MANTYVPVEMDIGSSRTVIVQIRSDVAEYFTITASTSSGDAVVTRRRKAHTRGVYGGLSDTSASTVNVSASTWQSVKRASSKDAGKLIRVPTKLEGKNNTVRMTSFRVPGNANIAAISKFIFDKFAATRRPAYFLMETGARYPVVNVTGDVNPGESDTGNVDP